MGVKIKDRVLSKSSDSLIPGTVIAIYAYEHYRNAVSSSITPPLWDEKYPNWQSQPIVLIKFDEATKPVSLPTFLRNCAEDDLKDKYKDDMLSRIANALKTHDKGLYDDLMHYRYDKLPELEMAFLPYADVDVLYSNDEEENENINEVD